MVPDWRGDRPFSGPDGVCESAALDARRARGMTVTGVGSSKERTGATVGQAGERKE